MKILMYGLNFWPEPTGIGKYSGEMAAWLAAQGHEVRIVTAPPYYPSWRVDRQYRWPPYRSERWEGVRIWRAPLWVPARSSGLARVVHLLSFALSSWPCLLRHLGWRPDVVLTVVPALTCAPAGWLIARLSGARAWLHLQDFEVDAAFQMGLLEGKWLRRAVLWGERRLLRRFDNVSSISHRMVERLHAKGVDPSRIRYFPNWVDLESIRPLARPSSFREQLAIPVDALVVLFSGTLGAKQGLSVIPEAARRLSHRDDIVFVVCGDGPLKAEIEDAGRSTRNLRLIPLQPVERLGELLGLADIHLLPQSPKAEDLVMPSKLCGMLASGRPVIATCRRNTEIGEFVSECGEIVAPEDAPALAAAIIRLAADPVRRIELGRRARRIAEETLEVNAVLRRISRDMDGEQAQEACSDAKYV